MRIPILRAGSAIYELLEQRWHGWRTQRVLGMTLVALFLSSLIVIELNRRGWLPAPLSRTITTSHFGAVDVAFTFLLVIEVFALIFALARSVADSVGKQFELLSLILLRKAFLEFGEFGEPIEWANAAGTIPEILADTVGALLIFVSVGLYYRLQRHRPIVADERERGSFIMAKKCVALVLLFAFAFIAIYRLAMGGPYFDVYRFFEIFYTVLIFSDILIVLISLVYTSNYHVVFRNSGFAAATVMIRLALTAPAFVSAALGLGGALFALGVSLAYNIFGPEVSDRKAI